MIFTAKKVILILFLFFISSEILIILPYMDDSNSVITSNCAALTTGVPIGHIVFTGDTSGKTDAAGCERLGSLSRRATILKGFHVAHLNSSLEGLLQEEEGRGD